MLQMIEQSMYSLSQLFMLPVLLLVAFLFFYAFYALGGFVWQARQRRKGNLNAFELRAAFASNQKLTATDLEGIAVTQMEPLRIASRIGPMLGLVATMIPMGPALMALSDGQLQQASHNLMVAFSAVILALIASSITYWIVSVRRRWFAIELAEIEKRYLAASPASVSDDPLAPLATEGVQ